MVKRKIVIVGGGTAGWLTAAYLSQRLTGAGQAGLDITVVESSDIPPIGVGEATVPTIRDTLAGIGISEYDFIRECDATFKNGIKFVQWNHPPETHPGEYYFHPFEKPLLVGTETMAGHWLKGRDPFGRTFEDAVGIQQQVAAKNLAPKRFDDRAYAGPLPYAYHLDAGKLAVMLRKNAITKGVAHIIGTVKSVTSNPDGNIGTLLLEDDRVISGDVFIDCTGFLSLLIEKHYKAEFINMGHILLCDKALAFQIPCEEADYEIPPYTTATAQTAGWVWDIGLKNRRGTGYVYSSTHQSADEAEATYRKYIGPKADNMPIRSLNMNIGYRKKQWVKNCIAVGLSGGFLEPLESTGIHMIEVALPMLVQMLPRYFKGGKPQDRYNEIMETQYEIVVDFIKLHYYLSSRQDSQFWRDNTSDHTATKDLIKKVKSWEEGYPNIYDLKYIHSIFDHSSYQYVFFGMGRRPKTTIDLGECNVDLASKTFDNVHKAFLKAQTILPDHKKLINRIHMT